MPVRQLIEFLTPASCLGCSAEGDLVCQSCIHKVTVPAFACFACGRLTGAVTVCAGCRPNYALEGVAIGAHYEEPVRELVLKLKFGHVRAAAVPAARVLVRALPAELVSQLDGVTSVPVAPGRQRERGYNQAALLARQVARRLDLPYVTTLRRRDTVHQLGAGRTHRLEQVEHAFEGVAEVSGTWLIIDDVVTTGATLNACAAILRQAGASHVFGAVVAGQRG